VVNDAVALVPSFGIQAQPAFGWPLMATIRELVA